MANSLLDLPQFSGVPALDDVLHIVDVSEADPKDRHILVSAFLSFVRASVRIVAAAAPTVNDDETLGIVVGQEWLDTTGPTLYMCTDATEAAAVWRVMVDWS